MTDRPDLEDSLAEMERKLRELQAELAGLSRERDAAAEAAPQPTVSEDGGRIAELARRVDHLAALCADVQHATRSLREELGGAAGPSVRQ